MMCSWMGFTVAVLTGRRAVAIDLVKDFHDGSLESRAVTLGGRAGDRLQILAGLKEGERLVASANFLVDAESRLGASRGMAAMPGMDMETGKKERP